MFQTNALDRNTVAWETPAGTEYLLGSGGVVFIPSDLYSGVEVLVDSLHVGGTGA